MHNLSDDYLKNANLKKIAAGICIGLQLKSSYMSRADALCILIVRHVTGNDQDYLYLRKIPRVVVQISALL
jgi:hypothetical protein